MISCCVFNYVERFCNSVTVSYTGLGFNITWNETLIGITVEAPCTGPGLNSQLCTYMQ